MLSVAGMASSSCSPFIIYCCSWEATTYPRSTTLRLLLIEITSLEISYDIVVVKNIDYYYEQVREKIKSFGVLIYFFENMY